MAQLSSEDGFDGLFVFLLLYISPYEQNLISKFHVAQILLIKLTTITIAISLFDMIQLKFSRSELRLTNLIH